MSATYEAAATAYRVLFQTADSPTDRDLRQLSTTHLKKTYRRRALECHPDRAQTMAGSPVAMAGEFSAVNGAYDILQRYLEVLRSRPPALPTRSRKSSDDQFWRGPVPHRSLPFGEFLFYTRRISWRMLNNALAWQRRDRPCFGELARSWGLLSQDRIELLLSRRHSKELIGQTAVRLGYITSAQADVIVGTQQKKQRPLGTYLVALRALSYEELKRQLGAHWQHNVAVSVYR